MKLKIVVSILLIMTLSLCLCACGDVSLSNKERNEITSAFAQEHNIDEQDVSFTCYGKFNKSYVLLFNESLDAVSRTEAAGVVFVSDSGEFYVYNSGEFYTLLDAYLKHLVTYENLLTVQRNHRNDNKDLYDEHLRIVILTEREYKKIASAYAKYYNEDVYFVCCGKFGKTYVLFEPGFGQRISRITVDGVTFTYASTFKLTAYRAGKCYSLQEAFDKGFITHDELAILQNGASGGTTTLTGKQQKEIVSAYAKLHDLEEKEVSMTCYGKFGDTYVMLSSLRGEDEIVGYTVGGVDFVFNLGRQFDVYHSGNFYTLQEAFDEGLLSHDNLITLQTNYKKEYGVFFDFFNKDKQN